MRSIRDLRRYRILRISPFLRVIPADGMLEDTGRPAAPVFVSWLGVTVYLEGGAIEETLAVAGGFAPGSEIVVDYMLPAGLRDAAGDLYAGQVGAASAERGEPWRSLLGPEEVTARLAGHGFGAVRHIRQRDMVPAAAWDRTDALRPAELSRIAHARTGRA